MSLALASEVTINANIAACMTKTYYWGFTRLTDVCSNRAWDIEWGSMDYLAVTGITGFGFAVSSLVLVLGYVMWRDG